MGNYGNHRELPEIDVNHGKQQEITEDTGPWTLPNHTPSPSKTVFKFSTPFVYVRSFDL